MKIIGVNVVEDAIGEELSDSLAALRRQSDLAPELRVELTQLTLAVVELCTVAVCESQARGTLVHFDSKRVAHHLHREVLSNRFELLASVCVRARTPDAQDHAVHRQRSSSLQVLIRSEVDVLKAVG